MALNRTIFFNYMKFFWDENTNLIDTLKVKPNKTVNIRYRYGTEL